ncbi:hypothetical protein C8J55DRAFT_504600 [Lentinula edodes]|uniref:Uncharacterized protein n=1 Tax=Lentinula lateritia TaxID=40482 RepID=A0A9W9AVU5_9AGAR|nr:hypothetical protein C8J55DRAFT_504600 [Lentinula edodes]
MVVFPSHFLSGCFLLSTLLAGVFASPLTPRIRRAVSSSHIHNVPFRLLRFLGQPTAIEPPQFRALDEPVGSGEFWVLEIDGFYGQNSLRMPSAMIPLWVPTKGERSRSIGNC